MARSLIIAHSVKPIHYGISLFDLQLGGSWGYKGIVNIRSNINGPAREVVLNSKEIDVQHAELLGADGVHTQASCIHYKTILTVMLLQARLWPRHPRYLMTKSQSV